MLVTPMKQREIMKILIVEDEPLIAMDLECSFEDAGHTVIGPADNVASAMALLESHQPDCACLDYNLHNENSMVIARALAERQIPYVFVTGQPGHSIHELGHSSEIVLSKPVDPERILQALQS